MWSRFQLADFRQGVSNHLDGNSSDFSSFPSGNKSSSNWRPTIFSAPSLIAELGGDLSCDVALLQVM